MIAIISDTHENVPMVRKALYALKDYNISFIVHLGDIVCPPMLEEFKGYNLKFVFGNNDGERQGLVKKAKELGFEAPDEQIIFEYENKKFLATHIEEFVTSKINSNAFDYVLVGHTHKRKNNKIFNTRVINPGALSFTPEPSIAVLDVKNDNVIFIDL